MRKMLLPEIQELMNKRESYDKQLHKKYDFKAEDFIIEPTYEKSTLFKWRHKDWKVWMKGERGISATKDIVNRYISECRKPLMKRNLDFLHIHS